MTRPNTDPNAAPTSAAFFVSGTPAPQGSKRAHPTKTGRVNLVESSRKVKPWRQAVAAAASAEGVRLAGAVHVFLEFTFQRPKSHYGTGRNATRLRDDAPSYPTSRTTQGDLDKLARSTLDGLAAGGLIVDDALVVDLYARKRYGTEPGAQVQVVALGPRTCATCGRESYLLTSPGELCPECFDQAWDAEEVEARAARFEHFPLENHTPRAPENP